MNPQLAALQPYPFEKLAQLLRGVSVPEQLGPILLSIGEPRHPTPALIGDTLIAHLQGLSSYPATRGLPALREAIADWLSRRFSLPPGAVDPERNVLPVNGTREALFSFAQAVIDPADRPVVVMPNPFYQIYEGAALLARAEPVFLNLERKSGFQPAFETVDGEVWRRCQLLYICTPGNPTGAVIELRQLQHLIELAERHDFVIASDECYSELYRDEANPPPGLLQAAYRMGNDAFRRCVVFHSLSKRSNAPGLRSGFVAGDAEILNRYGLYRTYHGSAMAPPVQHASIAAWRDEAHVIANREHYRRKFSAVHPILAEFLEVEMPAAGFYLWPRTPIGDTAFARGLLAHGNVTVLPGSFLSRRADGIDPGAGHVRIALVPELAACIDAAERIRDFVKQL